MSMILKQIQVDNGLSEYSIEGDSRAHPNSAIAGGWSFLLRNDVITAPISPQPRLFPDGSRAWSYYEDGMWRYGHLWNVAELKEKAVAIIRPIHKPRINEDQIKEIFPGVPIFDCA